MVATLRSQQGVFVYWITSNVFSFFQALGEWRRVRPQAYCVFTVRVLAFAVFKWQALRNALGIPDTRHLASPTGLKAPPVPPGALLMNKPVAKR